MDSANCWENSGRFKALMDSWENAVKALMDSAALGKQRAVKAL